MSLRRDLLALFLMSLASSAASPTSGVGAPDPKPPGQKVSSNIINNNINSKSSTRFNFQQSHEPINYISKPAGEIHQSSSTNTRVIYVDEPKANAFPSNFAPIDQKEPKNPWEKYPDRTIAIPGAKFRKPDFQIPPNNNLPEKGLLPVIKFENIYKEAFDLSKSAIDSGTLRKIGGDRTLKAWRKDLLDFPKYLYYQERLKEMHQVLELYKTDHKISIASLPIKGTVKRREYVSQILDHVFKKQEYVKDLRTRFGPKSNKEKAFLKAMDAEISRLKGNKDGDKIWDRILSGDLVEPSESQVFTLVAYRFVAEHYSNQHSGIKLRGVFKSILDLIPWVRERGIKLHNEILEAKSASKSTVQLEKEYLDVSITLKHLQETAQNLYNRYYPMGYLETSHPK